jgi:DNA-binding response OmpR family regulator
MTNKILLVDDDTFFHHMVKDLLPNYEILSMYSGEATVAKADTLDPDLILMDINMEEMDGYETARLLCQKNNFQMVPIVFISALTSEEDKLKAYGVGAIDYINKPFNHDEFRNKIDGIFKYIIQANEVTKQLQASQQLLTGIQLDAYRNQAISRFAQTSLFCHDFETLQRLFFYTARELNVSCVLKFTRNETTLRSDTGYVNRLEREVLELSPRVDKIFRFGHDRALFNWPHATLLVRNLDGLVDTLAIFMDALESACQSIENESTLLTQVEKIEHDNQRVKTEVDESFQEMKTVLSDMILSLGIVVELDMEEEDRIHDTIAKYQKKIKDKLEVFSDNGQAITRLIEHLREPPEEILKMLDDNAEVDDSEDVLF